MYKLRHAACVVLAAASLVSLPANATSFSTDQSDLYYVPTESGWGMQLVQRGSIIFATLFVYDQGETPTWYTATINYTSDFTWTGTLYASSGTYYGVPWNPMQLSLMPVGTMTWNAPLINGGTLTYVVNGVTVVKNVIRQALVLDNYNGHYAGYAHRVVSGCTLATNNGTFDEPITFNVTQAGSVISTVNTTTTTGNACTFTGTATEAGQMGEFDGTFTCTDGSAGTGSSVEVQVTTLGLSALRNETFSSPTGCQNNGWIGVSRVTTF
jgi:hypothetical protein